MSKIVKIEAKVNTKQITEKVENLIDEKTMLRIHELFAKLIDPWVPMLEGPLHQSGLAQIYADHIRYGGSDIGIPYARYQYYGYDFNFTKDYHPLASAEWDKVAMQTQMEVFEKGVKDIIQQRARELYG